MDDVVPGNLSIKIDFQKKRLAAVKLKNLVLE